MALDPRIWAHLILLQKVPPAWVYFLGFPYECSNSGLNRKGIPGNGGIHQGNEKIKQVKRDQGKEPKKTSHLSNNFEALNDIKNNSMNPIEG